MYNNIIHATQPFGLIDLFSHQQTIQPNDHGFLGHTSTLQLNQLRQKLFCASNPLNIIWNVNRFDHTARRNVLSMKRPFGETSIR